MKERLTERQNEAYEFVRSYLRQHSRPPTLREIGDALGIRSSNGVYKLLQALEKKGHIEREKHAARGLRLVEDEADPFALDDAAPSLLVISRTASDQPEQLRARPGGFLTVDPRLLRRARDPDACLIARAGDDGMNGDGIRKGDLLIVEEQPWEDVPRGAVAAVLIREELRARRLDVANGRLHLRPADRTYTEEAYPPDDPSCYVIGRVIGLLRSF